MLMCTRLDLLGPAWVTQAPKGSTLSVSGSNQRPVCWVATDDDVMLDGMTYDEAARVRKK